MTKNLDPIVKDIEINCDIYHAFEVFTSKMALWWPLKSHSCAMEKAKTVTVEQEKGGRIYETTIDGATHTWGTILTWNPPNELSYTWHPGFDVKEATQVSVQFRALADGRTALHLVHDGWAARGENAEDICNNYRRGWDFVLSCFAEVARSERIGGC